MPAPAVYVLAIVGTVGAVLAFKEVRAESNLAIPRLTPRQFVYEPHIAPTIDRWKLEYRTARDARRRRQAMEVSQDGSDSDLLMSETRKKSNGRPSDKYSDDDDSDEEAPGKGSATTGTSHSFMRGGLLIRRSTLVANSQVDVELDDLVAHEVNQWRNEVPGQVLRQRKNVSEHAMDEVLSTFISAWTHLTSLIVHPGYPVHTTVAFTYSSRRIRRLYTVAFSTQFSYAAIFSSSFSTHCVYTFHRGDSYRPIFQESIRDDFITSQCASGTCESHSASR